MTALLSVAAVLPGSSQNQNHAARVAPADQPPVPASEQLVLPSPSAPPVLSEQPDQGKPLLLSRAEVVNAFGCRTPTYWGLEAPGAMSRLSPGTPGIAVTVDFCGGANGSDFDRGLIGVLRERRVPATLFLNSRWIAANPATARELAADPLFELANHGTTHRPLSTTGRSAYGIPGTQGVGEVYDEVMGNDSTLTELTGTRPRFFRSGTAYFDDVAVQIVNALQITPVAFSVNADGGATYPAATVAREAAKARPGDIIICHGNHPRGGTAQGMAQALDTLAARGTPFLHLH
ncbi:polysaccharide deacetylase family protein [Pseudarthrobacter sp. NPDC080039]|uniref:polysaccharide deacetylase family protein n=1 Tax=unclassified Pseudarthrobacter TaxID=2647000 RepID=UPI003450B6B5